MATLNINNDIYERLSKKAAERQTTVDELVLPVLRQLAETNIPSGDRDRAFDEWMSLIKQRSQHLPADHILDDSRDSVYDGRGE